ncbi:MAG: hypothetical protein JEZ11_03590 [Desulfobacterales bacterium]|nr:hypothetical protein [Desulfobacterales bacterium]
MNSSSTEKREIRKFGLIAICFFGTIAALAIWRERAGVMMVFGTLAVAGVLFALVPGPMAPVYRGWLRVSHVIGRITTGIILTLTYYLAVTPVALAKRVFSGAPIPLRPDPQAETYWVGRVEPVQPKARFIKRY